MPNVTFGDARSILTKWESVAKYISVAPESTTPVAVVRSTRCWCVRLFRKLLLSKVKVDMSRVGLKLVL